ncbi:MAG: PASTA domain-containing protein [Lutibacter sp.]|uniref:PASTA domain-containing protein n=1 Tax=Lutibacter sp. TaxID=1925666 RepID=UPI0017924E77|nr:PASTA domain-containing protein [Lutibacter sp.]MBT8317489.1 PASTA domain-containing protein [Lutibacter sp.]NNJ58348.1 PASTA domain-containing protein [Lutibacter sp.]
MSIFQFIKSKLFLKQLIFAAVGLGVFFIVVVKWLDITTNHDQKIEVPNLEKMNLNEVEKVLGELELSIKVIDSASYNPSYPKQSVISHNPEAGDLVKEGRKIYLTLNPSNYANVQVPNLYGKTKRQANSQLKAIGFRVNSKELYVSDIAKDVVRGLQFNGKDLRAGDKIPKNSVITLKLGNGKGSGQYKPSIANSN